MNVELDQPATEAISLVEVMQALADPVRLQIVTALQADGERQCGTFDLGLSKATRSHHFKVLRQAGVTNTRVVGAARFVTLREQDLDARFPGLLASIVNAAR